MKTVLGVIFAAFGVFGLAWGESTYTTSAMVADIRSIHATRDEIPKVPLQRVAAAFAVMGGAVLLVAGRRE